MASINGIEAVELIASADPALALAVRQRGRLPVVERTADQAHFINGIRGVIFADSSGGTGSYIRLDSADPALALEARQRGQRPIVVVDESGEVVAGGEVTLTSVSVDFVNFNEHAAEDTLVGTITSYNVSSTLSLTGDAGGRFKLVGTSIYTGAVETDYETTPAPQITVTQTLLGAANTPHNTILTVTTMQDISGDTTPNAFSFTDITDATVSTLYTSNWVQITGLTTEPVATSVSGGEWRKADDGSGTNASAWGSTAGSVLNNKYVQVRHTSSASNSTATNTILTVGTVSDTYTTTTEAAASGFDPLTLFSGGIQGAWYDVQELGSMWQERNGSMTTPATVDGPVGHIEDLSPNGHDMFAASDAGRPLLRLGGDGVYYLENSNADGAYDFLESATSYTMAVPHYMLVSVAKSTQAALPYFSAISSTTVYHSLQNIGSGARSASISRIAAGTATATSGGSTNLADNLPYVVDSLNKDGANIQDVVINGGNKITATSFWASSDTAATTKVSWNRATSGATAQTHGNRFYGGYILNAEPAAADRTKLQQFFAQQADVPIGWSAFKLGAIATVASGNLTLTEPTGAAEGDLLVACIAARGNAPFTLPAGWSLVATQQTSGDTTVGDGIASGVMAYIIRGASAPSLVFTRTGGDLGHGIINGYVGAHATPYDTGSANTLAVSATAPTTGTLTTAERGELLVAMVAHGRGTLLTGFTAATDPTTTAGSADTTNAPMMGAWTERFDGQTTTGADGGLTVFDAVKRSAGATGAFTGGAATTSRSVTIVGAFKRLPFDLGGDGGESLFGGTIVGAPE